MLVLVRSSKLIVHKKRELVSSGRFLDCRWRVVFIWRYYVYFGLFHLFAFIEAAGLRSIVLRYTCAPTATHSEPITLHVLFCFVSFLFLERRRFVSEYFAPLPFHLCIGSTLCVSRPDSVFLHSDHGVEFWYQLILSYVKIQSINQIVST